MNKIYVLFVKRFPKEGKPYVYTPTYEVHYEPVQGKIAELNPGECIDVFKCDLADDESHIVADLYRISNVDGKAVEEFTESFLIERADS